MKYLITGNKGQLGFDINKELLSRGVEKNDILAIDKEEMDITDKTQVEEVIKEFNPNIIFHCAAWTAVDKAEEQKELCEKINVLGTKLINDVAKDINATMIYMSTDYIFDGTKDGLYNEEDIVNPKSIYGKTKYEGEVEVRTNHKHFITRISWVFGINGNNFIKTMLKLSETKKELNIINDQIGSPTYTVDLAKILVDMAQTNKYGTYNCTNEGYCSWADFARYIFKENNKDVTVNEVTTEKYLELTNTKQAYRPKNSRLSKQKLIDNFESMPTWEDATKRYLKELKEVK